MAGRLSITARDLRRLHALTDPSQLDQAKEPLPQSLLQGPADVIGCDDVVYQSHDIAGRVVTLHQRLVKIDGVENFSNEAVEKSFWGPYHRGLCDYWPRTGDYSSARQMLAEPQWQFGAAPPTRSGCAVSECMGRSRSPCRPKAAWNTDSFCGATADAISPNVTAFCFRSSTRISRRCTERRL